MIPSSTPRESKRIKAAKMSKDVDQLYKSAKCRDCTVVVTRMNFAKILGKFNRVKIQYENTSKTKKKAQTSPVNSRLKSNENGMVLIHRNAYNEHPVKEPARKPTPRVSAMKENNKSKQAQKKKANNILKESNKPKKSPSTPKPKPHTSPKAKRKPNVNTTKYYSIIFTKPSAKRSNFKNKFQLSQLLPIDQTLLPSAEWSVDYLPKTGEIKDDKVYDRIAAELEDLMSNEKSTKDPSAKGKDDFPSIMDILNDSAPGDNITINQSNISDIKTSLQSSDVEAMLLGKSESDDPKPEPVVVDQPAQHPDKPTVQIDMIDNPNSPSILDEALEQGGEEHIPCAPLKDSPVKTEATQVPAKDDTKNKENNNSLSLDFVTHVVFKKSENGTCQKSVTCPMNLKYSVELQGKHVEFLGAPKFITSADDLRILLQIVNESELNRTYLSH